MGSVTQSSNIDSATKVTLDQISIVFDDTTGGVIINRSREGMVNRHSIGAGTNAGRLHDELEEDPDDFPFKLLKYTLQGARGYIDPDPPAGTGSLLVDYFDANNNVVLRFYDNGVKVPEPPRGENPCHEAAGTCYFLFTNKRALSVQGDPSSSSAPLFDPNHLDYWAVGYWVSPDGAPTEMGVFAVPSMPLTTDQMATVSQPATPITATYQGVFWGRAVEDFEALFGEITLVASFSLADSTIRGSINDGGDNDFGGHVQTLFLNEATIDFDLTGGFFTGTTSYQIEGEPLQTDTGHWGGQFFGGVDTADNLPNSVTGTIAAKTPPAADPDAITVGVFVADKQ